MIGEIDIFSKQNAIRTIVIGSIMVSLILLAISNSTFSFVLGQADLTLMDSANSKNISNDFSEGLGSPFYTENTNSTNFRVTNIDLIPTVEVTIYW